jgi:hypothetical protein
MSYLALKRMPGELKLVSEALKWEVELLNVDLNRYQKIMEWERPQ